MRLYAKAVAIRIQFRRARHDDFVCPQALQQREIIIEGARISQRDRLGR